MKQSLRFHRQPRHSGAPQASPESRTATDLEKSLAQFYDRRVIGRLYPATILMPFAVYMLASRRHGTLYIGVTNNLTRRIQEHKAKRTAGFTARYDVDRLVWYELYQRPIEAIQREKSLKTWRRDWKIRLIEEANPDWSDLTASLSL